MPITETLLWGVLLPAAVAALVWCVGRRPWRGPGQESGVRWWESQALALAFLVGYAGQFGPPRTPLGEVPPGAQDWLVWIVLAVGVLYSGRPRRWRLLRSRPVIAAASLALLLRAMIEHHWEGLWALAWCCGLFALLLGSWWSGDGLVRRAPTVAAPVLVMTGAALALCAGFSGSAKLAQAAAPLCAGLGTLWVLDRCRASAVPATGAVALTVLALFGLGVSAFFYSSLPATQGLLLCGALPLALAAAGRESGEGARRIAAPLAAAIAPLALAVLLAWLAFEPDPYGY